MEITDFEDRLIESALAIQEAWEPEFHDITNPKPRFLPSSTKSTVCKPAW